MMLCISTEHTCELNNACVCQLHNLVQRLGARKMYNILNKSENATLQLFIFSEKVFDKKYLLKLINVAQTSSKRFVETPFISLV